MANAITEHSRKLRSKTALEYGKRALADGTLRQITMRLHAQMQFALSLDFLAAGNQSTV